MSFLRDVNVSKISFVHKAANKKKFLLLKSEDSNGNDKVEETVNINNNNNTNTNNEGYKPMRKEVKESILKIIKSATPAVVPNDIVETLKKDAELKLSENEISEVTDFLDMYKEAAPASTKEVRKEEKKEKEDVVSIKKEEYDSLRDEVSSLKKSLEQTNNDNKKQNLITWLERECPFLPDKVGEVADNIIALEKHDTKLAETYKNNLVKTSAAIQTSKLFSETGKSTDALLKEESDGFDLIRKFTHDVSELRKSADGGKLSADGIADIIRSYGNEYSAYREAHILRAKHHAI